LTGQTLQILISQISAEKRRGPADLLLDFAKRAEPPVTFLAVCPNSLVVATAALCVASRLRFPLFFAATLNQIDRSEGYTPWTPESFAKWVEAQCVEMTEPPMVLVGLDHGGPWKKDIDYQRKLDAQAALRKVEDSIESCLSAGYKLLHIDATEDPFNQGPTVPVETIVERTIQLIRFAEDFRVLHDLPPVSYEVGTEEVSGGLNTFDRFKDFVDCLHAAFERARLLECWPCFFVGDVGTDLGTTHFDEALARSLNAIVRPYGSMLKGHYTDFVDTPDRYPGAGMGGANIGPELSAVEYQAVMELAETSRPDVSTIEQRGARSDVEGAIRDALIGTGRWRKWLRDDEVGQPFEMLDPERRRWLLATGSRYVWADAAVESARKRMYARLGIEIDGPRFVQSKIEESISGYAVAFGLVGVNRRLAEFFDQSI
jgi:tagatose-1,6-bisphosphate aldolase non-catalytic subunit AgaZ/GatZ